MSANPVDGFRRRPPLGRILVERGVLTEAQLNTALDEQQRTGERLGAVLLRLGYTAGPTIGLGLATQHGQTLKTEYGFAVPDRGARSLADEEAQAPPPLSEGNARVLGPQSHLEQELAAAAAQIAALEAERETLLAQTEQLRDHDPDEHADDASHLVFGPVGNCYLLFELPGPPPAAGSTLRLRQPDGSISAFLVAKVGAAPLPGITLGCAYLIDLE